MIKLPHLKVDITEKAIQNIALDYIERRLTEEEIKNLREDEAVVGYLKAVVIRAMGLCIQEKYREVL